MHMHVGVHVQSATRLPVPGVLPQVTPVILSQVR